MHPVKNGGITCGISFSLRDLRRVTNALICHPIPPSPSFRHSSHHPLIAPDLRHVGQDGDTLANLAVLYANARAQNQNAGQEKPATGNPPDPSGATRSAKPAPLKSETPHEIGGQLV